MAYRRLDAATENSLEDDQELETVAGGNVQQSAARMSEMEEGADVYQNLYDNNNERAPAAASAAATSSPARSTTRSTRVSRQVAEIERAGEEEDAISLAASQGATNDPDLFAIPEKEKKTLSQKLGFKN